MNDFDLEKEAWAYIRSVPRPTTEAQMKAFVNDWMTKDDQVDLGMKYFCRDVTNNLRGKKVLEFGCGIGGAAFGLERLGAEVVGADIDEKELSIARRWGAARGSRCQFVQVGRELPFAEGEFDYVYSSSTFEHLADPGQALREIARVLKPGGAAYICFPNRLYPKEAHTNLTFLPWMPRPLAMLYVGARLPGWDLDGNTALWFYSYLDFLRVLRRSGANLRVVVPPVGNGGGWKTTIKRVLHTVGIPYSAFAEGLALRLEHYSSTR